MTTSFPDRTQAIVIHKEQAYKAWQERDFAQARLSFFKYVESVKQQNVNENGALSELHESAKLEYSKFVREDPLYHEILEIVLPIIEKNPGIKQTAVYTQVKSFKKEDVAYALYFAADHGRIRRDKSGSTYELFLPELANDDQDKVAFDESVLEENAETKESNETLIDVTCLLCEDIHRIRDDYLSDGMTLVCDKTKTSYFVKLCKIRSKKQNKNDVSLRTINPKSETEELITFLSMSDIEVKSGDLALIYWAELARKSVVATVINMTINVRWDIVPTALLKPVDYDKLSKNTENAMRGCTQLFAYGCIYTPLAIVAFLTLIVILQPIVNYFR